MATPAVTLPPLPEDYEDLPPLPQDYEAVPDLPEGYEDVPVGAQELPPTESGINAALGLQQDVGRALVRGVGGVIESFGGAMDVMEQGSPTGLARMALQRLGVPMAVPENLVTKGGAALRETVAPRTTKTFEPSNPQWWAESLPEVVPQLGAQLGLAALTGGASVGAQMLAFTGSGGVMMAGQQYNDALKARKERGESDETARPAAAAEGAIVGTIGAALERIPGGEFLTKGPIAGWVGKVIGTPAVTNFIARGGAEALTEVAQELTSIGAETVRGEKFDADAATERLKASALLGAAAGSMASPFVDGAKGTEEARTLPSLEPDLATGQTSGLGSGLASVAQNVVEPRVEVKPEAGVIVTERGAVRPTEEGDLVITPESVEGRSVRALLGEDALTRTPAEPSTALPAAGTTQAPTEETRPSSRQEEAARLEAERDRLLRQALAEKDTDARQAKLLEAKQIDDQLKALPTDETTTLTEEATPTSTTITAEETVRPAPTEPARPVVGAQPAPTVTPPAAPETPVEASEPQIGIRNAITDKVAQGMGLEARKGPDKKTAATQIAEGQAVINDNPQAGAQLIEALKVNPRPMTDTEDVVLTFELAARKTAYNRARESALNAKTPEARIEAEAAVVKARNDVADAIAVNRAVGTQNARGLEARKRMIDEQFDLPEMEAEVQLAAGDKAKPSDSTEVQRLHEAIKKSQETIDRLTAQLAGQSSQGVFDAMREDVKREAKKGPAEGRGISDFIHDQAEAARKRIAARRGQTFADPLGIQVAANLADHVIIGADYIIQGAKRLGDFTKRLVADFGEEAKPFAKELFDKSKKEVKSLTSAYKDANKPKAILDSITPETGLTKKAVYDLTRAAVAEGVGKKGGREGFNEVTAHVTQQLQQKFPNLTERQVRDAFSDYGKVRHPSKDEIDVKLRELRRADQLISAIEDVMAGRPPRKTGDQRDKPTQTLREMQAELRQLMAKNGIETTSPEQQLASRNQARETALRNQIEDLDKQLQGFERAPKGTPPPDSATVERLRSERDAMRAELNRIQAEENPPISPEQKALNDALVARERVNRQLEGDDATVAKQPKEALTQLEEDIRAETQAMRAVLREQRAEARPKKDPNAARIAAQEKALEKSIDEYARKVREADFSTRGPKQGPDPQRIAELKAIRESRRKMYDLARKLARPVVDPEVRRLDNAKKAIQRRTDELKRRIREGDFSKKERKPIAEDKELDRLRFENDKAKNQYYQLLAEAEARKRGPWAKTGRGLMEGANLARAVMTSADVSAVLRQGGFVALGHPALAAKNIPGMIAAGLSEQTAHTMNENLQKRDNYRLYQQSGLYLSDDSKPSLSKAEEAYMSRWLRKSELQPGQPGRNAARVIKNLATAPVRASARAYSTFLNQLRADTFDTLVATLSKTGTPTKEEAAAIANYINVATGRGPLGAKIEPAGQALATIFFAPRYVVSRFQLIGGQPLYGGSARTRKLIAKEYARFLTGLAVVYGLAAAAQDDDDPAVVLDPRSSDFGKIRFGQTRLDPLSGLAQATTFLARTLSGETKTLRGDTLRLNENYRPLNAFRDFDPTKKAPFGTSWTDVVTRFGRTKLAPIPGAIWNFFEGENVVGEPTDIPTELSRLFVPMSFRDIGETMEAQGVARGTALTMLSLLGMGVQTYAERVPKSRSNRVERLSR